MKYQTGIYDKKKIFLVQNQIFDPFMFGFLDAYLIFLIFVCNLHFQIPLQDKDFNLVW